MAVACDQIKTKEALRLPACLILVQEEGRMRSKEGHQPIHKRALRRPGQASIEVCEGACDEEMGASRFPACSI